MDAPSLNVGQYVSFSRPPDPRWWWQRAWNRVAVRLNRTLLRFGIEAWWVYVFPPWSPTEGASYRIVSVECGDGVVTLDRPVDCRKPPGR